LLQERELDHCTDASHLKLSETKNSQGSSAVCRHASTEDFCRRLPQYKHRSNLLHNMREKEPVISQKHSRKEESLIQATVLTHAKANAELALFRDASDNSIGAVL